MSKPNWRKDLERRREEWPLRKDKIDTYAKIGFKVGIFILALLIILKAPQWYSGATGLGSLAWLRQSVPKIISKLWG